MSPAEERNRSSEVVGDICTGVAVVGGTVAAGYLIYRVARMIPSLFPPLWWTIPANAAIP